MNFMRNLLSRHFSLPGLAITCFVAYLAPACAQTAPTIVSNSPISGKTGISQSAPVIIAFSKAMDPVATVVKFINNSSFPPPILPTIPTWSDDHTMLTNTPTPIFPAKSPIIWTVNGRDTAGTMLSGTFSGGFVTGGTAATPPTLVSVSPASLSTNVPTSTAVVFTFSAAMNTSASGAQFSDIAFPMTNLTMVVSWSSDKTKLTCTPNPPFPAGTRIVWSLAGQDVLGTPYTGGGGSFFTAGSSSGSRLTGSGLVSYGELIEQTETNLFETVGPEIIGLAGTAFTNSVILTAPAPGQTSALCWAGAPDAVEFSDSDSDTSAFATNYPLGAYQVAFAWGTNVSRASLTLSTDALPSAPRAANQGSTPYVVLGQPWTLNWDFANGGAAIDYVRMRIEQNGTIVFASPLPDNDGALNGASNTVVVPAGAFAKVGRAAVSLTAFSFTALDTNSIPGVTLRAALHRTTEFELRVVDGTLPPPVLLTTNMGSVPVGMTFMNPLFTTNGVRPLKFEQIGGSLPPGMTLEAGGTLTGQTASEGTFDATLRMTDLIGRVSTQALRVVTVPPPASVFVPSVENVGRASRTNVVFDVVGGSPSGCVVEYSTNLLQWTTFLTTNAPADRLTLQIPIASRTAFFRVRGPGDPLPTPNPLTVGLVLNSNMTATAKLDEFGGRLSLTNAAGYVFTLNVPPDALDRTETITMTDVAKINGLPLSGGLSAAVDLQPEGLLFNTPARLDITSPTPLNPASLMGFGAQADGSEFALQLSFITNRTVSLHLQHFTMAGAGNGTAANAQGMSQNSPSDPGASTKQQMAANLADCKADPDCSPESLNEEMIKLCIQLADQSVIPKLKQAVGNDDMIDGAVEAWLDWLRTMELLGLYNGNLLGNANAGELAKRVRVAGNLATQAIHNGVTKSCQKCMEHDIARIYRMLDLARMGALIGLSYEDEVWKCARKCLVFELEIESKITSQSSVGTMATDTKAKIKLKPIDDDVVVQLKLLLSGSGQWNITKVDNVGAGECTIADSPSAGQLIVPYLKIGLYQKRVTRVPFHGYTTTYEFKPDMKLFMRSDPALAPAEGRRSVCPDQPDTTIADTFGRIFEVFHINEEETPQSGSIDEMVMGGSVFRMTGFQYGGLSEVILSKDYEQTGGEKTQNTESTHIKLRHKPGK